MKTHNMTQSNVTQPPINVTYSHELFNFSIYIGFGTILFLGDSLVVLVVMRTKQLRRREYWLMAMLAVSDAVYGLGYLIAGANRCVMIMTESVTYIERWRCALQIHSWLFTLGALSDALMLLFLTLDRLFSVVFPSRYVKQSCSYIVSIGAIVIILNLADLALWFGVSFTATTKNELILGFCYAPDTAGSPVVVMLHAFFIFSLCTLSVVLYIPVMVLTNKRLSVKCGSTPAILTTRQRTRQRRLNKSISFIAISTLFLYCLPFVYGNILRTINPGWFYKPLVPYSYMLMLTNCVATLYFYFVRNHAMQQATLKIFRMGLKSPAATVLSITVGIAGDKLDEMGFRLNMPIYTEL